MVQVAFGDKKKSRADGVQFFANLFEKAKIDDRVSTLDIPATIGRLSCELANIKKLVVFIDGWTKYGFEDKRTELEDLIRQATENFKALPDMREPLHIVIDDVKVVQTRGTRRVRDTKKS